MGRRISGREWIAFGGVVAVFWLLRFPLYREPAVRLGWHSDAAVFGLQARDIYEGHFHFFWWGQSYLGTLTQMFGALGGFLVAPFGVSPPVGPLGMRVGTAIEWLLMIAFYWLAMRVAFGPAVAIVVALLLTMGPDWFFHSGLAPRGAEMHLFMSAALLLFAAGGLRRRRDWLLFGLLSGLGWWFHQGVIFTIGAIVLVVVLRSDLWPVIRESEFRLGPIDAAFLLWMASGALHEFVPAVPAFFLFRPVLEPFALWALYRALRAAARHGRALWVARRDWLTPLGLFAAGALAGYSPVLVASARGAFEKTYGFAPSLHALADVPPQIWRVLREDFWTLIGSRGVIAFVLLALLAAHAFRHRRAIASFLAARPADYGLRGVAAASVVFSLLFYVASPRAFSGAVRYLAPVLPVLFAFALSEAEQWWTSSSRPLRVAAAAAVLIIAGGYALATMRLVDDIKSSRAEGRFYTGPQLAAGPSFDPHPVIAAIDRGGWRVCYAPFGVGMNLEWLSDRRIRFMSYRSVEPRRDLAARLAAQPGRKCFVDWNGNVREWDPREHDDAVARAARERAQKR